MFLLRSGPDIASVEWYARSVDEVTSRVVVNEAEESRYTLQLRPDASVARMDLETLQPGQAATRLSIPLNRPGRDTPVGEAAAGVGVTPVYDQAPVGMLQQVVLWARSQGARVVEVPVFRFVGRSALSARVTFPGARVAHVELGGKSFHLALDDQDRIIGGVLPAYGMTIERRRTMPRTAYQPWPKYGAPTGAAYRASEVRIPTSAGHVLAGTLTLPTRPAPGKVSAVLLITGSGKNERNQGNSPSMPFRQLADALSRRGIAVLRVDDRGVGGSTGVWGTTLDEAADVRSALAYLRARPDIDRSRLALLGWSEGGMIAPVVAADDPEIRALILMCAPADGQETAEYQVRYAVEQSPAVPPEARERVIAETLAAAGDSPRARSMLSLDTSAHAQRVRAPVLLLHGGNDRHVPSHSTAKLAAAFGSAGSEVTMRVFPNLNHVFLPDPDGRAGAWAFLPSARVPSEVLDTVADWAAARLTPRPAQTLRPAA